MIRLQKYTINDQEISIYRLKNRIEYEEEIKYIKQNYKTKEKDLK